MYVLACLFPFLSLLACCVVVEWWWIVTHSGSRVGWLATDHFFPEWDAWMLFMSQELTPALSLDSLRSSHPIEATVHRPAEVEQIFDQISYAKGASVVRMLSAFLGQDVFLAGVARYLKQHIYGNARTRDLWASLSAESGMDVSRFMALWTQQTGYPVLTVTRQGSQLAVRQSRYLSTGDVHPEDDQNTWWVPLGLITSAASTDPQNIILESREATIPLPQQPISFYKLNLDQKAIFRVKYPTEDLRSLSAAVAQGTSGLRANDKVGVLMDALALARSGQCSTTDFLEVLDGFKSESNYL